ncbi:MAG: hypothetical protein JOZ47_05820 [Kutzneria sp.]|nr:hypothetical protein [Kutzneria sp.]MBV9844570.1 hypothetical protein [Kutzneria sp.]
MTADELIRFIAGLPGVAVVTAGEDTGAPEVAWGDSFFFYDPDGDVPVDRRLPFATIVTKDYTGFDTASNLNRPGVFRLNIAVGRERYQSLLGHTPAEHSSHRAGFDYSAVDQLLPNPSYAAQAWIAVLNPAEATGAQVRSLLTEAHARAAERHRPRR